MKEKMRRLIIAPTDNFRKLLNDLNKLLLNNYIKQVWKILNGKNHFTIMLFVTKKIF